jgi:competence protein ComFC
MPFFMKALLRLLFPKTKDEQVLESLSAKILLGIRGRTRPSPLGMRAVLPYRDPLVRTLIWELKYRGNRHAAKLCAEILYRAFGPELLRIHENNSSQQKLFVIPIPASRETLHERGFNQCERIARIFAEYAPVFELRTDCLLKKSTATHQAKLSEKKKRRENVRNSFFVANSEALVGKDVLLLDDVITTGATMEEARKALLAAGVGRVRAVAVAH